MSALHVVSLRAPSPSGTGDAKRAAAIIDAASGLGVTVTSSSILSANDSLGSVVHKPLFLLGLMRACLIGVVRGVPLQVLLVQHAATRSGLRVAQDQHVLFVTARVIPATLPAVFSVDFVDCLAENTRMRGRSHPRMSRFWAWEALRMERWERRAYDGARAGYAVSSADAGLLGQGVVPVPLAFELASQPSPQARDSTVVFAGSLFYEPNDEAVRWLLSDLVPELCRRGVDAADIVVTGRGPRRSLRRACRDAGVTLRADVDDLIVEIDRAGVLVAPIDLGSGVQSKVLNALASGCPVVMTPRASRGLDLPPLSDVRIVDRDPRRWADHIEALLASPVMPDPRRATVLARHGQSRVREAWMDQLDPLLRGAERPDETGGRDIRAP